MAIRTQEPQILEPIVSIITIYVVDLSGDGPVNRMNLSPPAYPASWTTKSSKVLPSPPRYPSVGGRSTNFASCPATT